MITCLLSNYRLWEDKSGIWRLVERILWTEEPGGLPSTGSHGVGHDWSDLAAAGEQAAAQEDEHGGQARQAHARGGVLVLVPKARLSAWRPVTLLYSHEVKWRLGEGRPQSMALTLILDWRRPRHRSGWEWNQWSMTQVYVHDMTTILVRLDPFWLDGGPQSCLPIRITLGSLPGQDSQDETGVGLEGPGHRHFVNCSRAFTDKKNLRIPTAPTPFTTIRIFHVFKGNNLRNLKLV